MRRFMRLEVGVEEGVGFGAEADGVEARFERVGARLDERRLGLEHLEVGRGPLAAEADGDGVGALGLGDEPLVVKPELGEVGSVPGDAPSEVGGEPDQDLAALERLGLQIRPPPHTPNPRVQKA